MIVFALLGAGLTALVMFLAGLLAKPTAKAPPQPADNQPDRGPAQVGA